MDERPIETATEHRCVLGVLTERLAATERGDRPSLAADALARMLAAGRFDACCLPRYVALAPERFSREVQIPIAETADIQTRVIVWPVGAHDGKHPHSDGWTVFVPVQGQLVTRETSPSGDSVTELVSRAPVVLRPEERIAHLVRNVGDAPAVSVHISGH